MNEEEIAAKNRIEELEKELAALESELFFAWDRKEYQRQKIEELKRNNQETKDAESEFKKREEIHKFKELSLETRGKEIGLEIEKLNQNFPNLIKKLKEERDKKAKDKSKGNFQKSIGILSALSIGIYGAYAFAADRLQLPIWLYEGGMPQNLLKNRPDPVVPIIRKYNIKKPKWRGLRTLNSCTKLKSIELIAWRKYNQIGIKSKEAEKELDKLYVWGYWFGCTAERYG